MLSSEIDILRKKVEDLQLQLAKQERPFSPVLNKPPIYSGDSDRKIHTESPRAYSSVTKDPNGQKGESKNFIYSSNLFEGPTSPDECPTPPQDNYDYYSFRS